MEFLDPMPEEFWWAILLTASALLILLTLFAMGRRRLDRWRRSRRQRRAARGERQAQNLLRRQGFIPVDDQVRTDWTVLVDDEPQTFELIADLIVEKQGRRYIVEVKTGRLGPSITYAATRRQLLEYRCAFAVDGLLLLDMNTGQWQAIEFPDLPDLH